jgi:hypothetical protein
MSAPEVQLSEQFRQMLDSLQHSHVVITKTTRGVTFEVKARDKNPYEAAKTALDLYLKLKKELKIE